MRCECRVRAVRRYAASPVPELISKVAPGVFGAVGRARRSKRGVAIRLIDAVAYCKYMDSEAALDQRYAHLFPVRNHLIYLNHAAVAPLCKPAADAMKHLAEDCTNFGSLHYPDWLAAYEGVRDAAARLTGGKASEIALMKNTSEGIATVAMGLDWKVG